MRLNDYFKHIDVAPTAWAKNNNLKPVTVWRITKGTNIPSPDTALRIQEATGGAVTVMELLYPTPKETE
jgi:hypothetical protein